MKRFDRSTRTHGGVRSVWLLLGVIMCGLIGATAAYAQDVEALLTQVGEEYAIAYSSPFLHSFGPNANSNMYSTASIPWGGIQFGFGVKFMGSQLSEDDQTFTRVITGIDLGAFDSGSAGQTGTIIMSGPTIFGDTETVGQIQGLVNGIEVFSTSTIPGLVDTRWSPLVTPEAYIGGVGGLKLTVRFLPEMDTGDYGKTKYWGYGLQWNANGILKNLPVDVMAGFFTQEINVGSVYKSKASTYFVGASKSYTKLTVYGGFALEDSKMDVTYEFVNGDDPTLNTKVDFTVDGLQDSRVTVGATLDILAKLNFEIGLGNSLTTYSAGLMFGF